MPWHLLLLLATLSIWGHAEPGEERRAAMAAAGFPLPDIAPLRGHEGRGPFKALWISNVMLIDGQGSPPRGPLHIVVRGNRIASISTVPPQPAPNEQIDGTGLTVLPGFIDSHAHIGNGGTPEDGPPPPEYIFKLWLAHGITTIREVGATLGLTWTVKQARLSEENKIVAPRIVPFSMFPGNQVVTAEAARTWVRSVHRKGARGIKLRGGTRAAMTAVYEEAARLELGTANHHDQNGVYHMNVLDSARLGLDSMEHWYGLPEALFTHGTIQDYPAGYNYSDEQWRFREAGRLWAQAAEPGSRKWQTAIDELVDLDFTLSPTFTVYEANRDVMRARDAEWHAHYTLPGLKRFFGPDPHLHGSYHFDWTTADEVAWRNNFLTWMQFVNDYKNAGGRVVAGSDAGFIFKLYGFAFVRELELLQEAGFHPLEVLQAATLNGAELLNMDTEIGSLVPGKKADLVLIEGNPLANFKLLYGTGHMFLDREAGQVVRKGGVRFTVKDGIVYDAKALLADVADMVSAANAATQPRN